MRQNFLNPSSISLKPLPIFYLPPGYRLSHILSPPPEELDKFVQQLQEQIHEESRKAYGEKAFERWLNPQWMGALEDADGWGRIVGSCGDAMEIFLKFENNRVKEASFRTSGCGASVACGSFAAEMAIGKSPDELLHVTAEAILETLGGLPQQEEHCAQLASETLQEALHSYMIVQTRKGG